MTTAISSQPIFPLPSDHLEQVSRAVSVLTVDPFKSTLFYLFPLLGAYFKGSQELRVDPSQEAMMPQESTTQILREIEQLTRSAGIERQIVPYIGLHHEFACCGGDYSFTKPVLFLPDQHLFRRAGRSPFSQELPPENLRAHPWLFSDDETRFLLARELGQIKENTILIRIAIKVSLIGALFAFASAWAFGLLLLAGSTGLYIASERLFQARADAIGVEILGRRINDPRRARQIAIETLEKQRQQNLHRRNNTRLGRFYITSTGANILDLTRPFLSKRIDRLRTMA
jgi:hypothetical protein